MDDEHRSPYVGTTNNLWWKEYHNYSHFGLVNIILLNFVYLIYIWNGHCNTYFHVIIIGMYYWNMV
jgi:hypothetical protein